MLLNCGVGEHSWESLGLQGDPTRKFSKGNQFWIFIGRTDVENEAPILWPLDVKNCIIRKDLDAGIDWRQEERDTTEEEMIGWYHWLDGHEFDQARGVELDFVALHELPLVAVLGLLIVVASLVAACGLQKIVSTEAEHKFSWPAVCGIFPDQGLNLCPLHWQADSLSLDYQGCLEIIFLYIISFNPHNKSGKSPHYLNFMMNIFLHFNVAEISKHITTDTSLSTLTLKISY